MRPCQLWQVSFGIWETEERAARQYDRALIVEKGRAAKTNFPLATYKAEVAHFEALLRERRALPHSGPPMPHAHMMPGTCFKHPVMTC